METGKAKLLLEGNTVENEAPARRGQVIDLRDLFETEAVHLGIPIIGDFLFKSSNLRSFEIMQRALSHDLSRKLLALSSGTHTQEQLNAVIRASQSTMRRNGRTGIPAIAYGAPCGSPMERL